MAKTIVIVGFGPGISTAMAEKFGAEGFRVALVARDSARLAEGVEALKASGIAAAGFPADASDPAAIAAALAQAREVLGPIAILHWNAFGGAAAPDLLATDPAAVRQVFDVAIVGLLAAVQQTLPDLKAAQGALLVTNGAFGEMNPMMDAFAIRLSAMGVALANAAKAKLVGLLSERLKADGVYVGEVTVAGAIKGTPTDSGGGIEGARVADRFWELYRAREGVRARVG
ncbi:MAG TPA: SDR family NAD(P)-dependent oxidoreductase [Caulobacteraceae bacterium]|nr:SDR family NAD(P)-dependent oxidoreductase [Caulobacteraceae bacterium]